MLNSPSAVLHASYRTLLDAAVWCSQSLPPCCRWALARFPAHMRAARHDRAISWTLSNHQSSAMHTASGGALTLGSLPDCRARPPPHRLTATNLAELDAAVRHVEASGLALEDVGKVNAASFGFRCDVCSFHYVIQLHWCSSASLLDRRLVGFAISNVPTLETCCRRSSRCPCWALCWSCCTGTCCLGAACASCGGSPPNTSTASSAFAEPPQVGSFVPEPPAP